jgi:hypothetical protein
VILVVARRTAPTPNRLCGEIGIEEGIPELSHRTTGASSIASGNARGKETVWLDLQVALAAPDKAWSFERDRPRCLRRH